MSDVANHLFLPWVQPARSATAPDAFTERLAADQAAAITVRVELADQQQHRCRRRSPVRAGRRHRHRSAADRAARAEAADGGLRAELLSVRRVRSSRFSVAVQPDQGRRARPAPALARRRRDSHSSRACSCGRRATRRCRCSRSRRRPAGRRAAGSGRVAFLGARADHRRGADAQTQHGVSPPIRRERISRVICARRLKPATEYLACVVPAFEVGRAAGLNQPLDDETLRPAWLSGDHAPSAITLPVYCSWEFRTVGGERFRRARAAAAAARAAAGRGQAADRHQSPGIRAHAAAGAPEPPGRCSAWKARCASRNATPDAWPDATRGPFQSALADILDTPWQLASRRCTTGDPIVAPPIYGAWHAAVHQVEPERPPRQRAVLVRRAQSRSAPSRRGGDGHAGRPGSIRNR